MTSLNKKSLRASIFCLALFSSGCFQSSEITDAASDLTSGSSKTDVTATSTGTQTSTSTPNPLCANLGLDGLLNGSFEQLNTTIGIDNELVQNQIIDLKTWDIFETVAGWNSADGDGIELWGGGFNGVTPSDGKVLMEIKGNEANIVSQDFCATAGRKKISLDVYARTGLFGDNIVNVSFDDTNVLHIDPAHQFFKTYTTDFVLTAGKHTLTFSSEAGTNASMGGLIDNVILSNFNPETDRLANVGVSTILMTLSEIPVVNATSIIGDAVTNVSAVKTPKVLFVRSIYSSGEGIADFTFIPQTLTTLGYSVTSIDEPKTGLSLLNVNGYDVVWFNNPGYPEQNAVTLETLAKISQNKAAGVVLSGDDISSPQYVNMPELTHLDYGNNGTSACNTAIDNNNTAAKYVVTYKNLIFNYGDDIDQDKVAHHASHHIHGHHAHGNGLNVLGTAKTNIPNCNVVNIPVIVNYKVK